MKVSTPLAAGNWYDVRLMPQQHRRERIATHKGGWAGTSSADFSWLVEKLHRCARAEADSLSDGNTSSYVWAALPMLVSGLTAFVVEQEAMLANQRDEDRVALLLKLSLQEQFSQLYGVSGQLLEDLKDLVELRNEIIHPAHMATGTPDNWPDELRHLKTRGLLSSTGDAQSDYLMLEQMKSVRLLEWAMRVVEQLRAVVLQHCGQRYSPASQ